MGNPEQERILHIYTLYLIVSTALVFILCFKTDLSFYFSDLSMKKCFVEKVVNVNSNTDFIGFWLLIQIMNVEAFSVIGSDFHPIVSVSNF